MAGDNPPDGVGEDKCFVTMEKVLKITDEFPFCSHQFTAFLNTMSDNDIVREFEKSKDRITENGVFELNTSCTQRYLQTARIAFNRLTDEQKGEFNPDPAEETIQDYRDILGSGEFIGSGSETLAMDIDTKKASARYRKQVESQGVYCVLCEDEGKDAYFVKSNHYFEHMDMHRHAILYGCHHCHMCMSSLENYYNHTCKGTARAVRKKYANQRDFKTSHSMMACTDCGYTQNIHQSLSKAMDVRQMELLKTLYTNHNCKNLVVLKVLTTDSVQRATQENWKAEFFLPLTSSFGNKKECCGTKFNTRGKFIQHMYDHLPENSKMAAFIRTLHFQSDSCDTRKDCIGDQNEQRIDTTKAADNVAAKFPRRTRELSMSATFYSDSGTKRRESEDAVDFSDFRPNGSCFSEGADPVATSSDRILTISFVSFHNKAEPCPIAGLDQTLVCKKCRAICLDDVSAGAHFSVCSTETQVSRDLPYNVGAFNTLVFRNTLPTWFIRCLEPNCGSRCCSLEGFRTHMALAHGFLVEIAGTPQTLDAWPSSMGQLTTAEAINEFCGLTKNGLLRGILSQQCYQPGSGVNERQRRRRGGLFKRREAALDGTLIVVAERIEDAVVPEERKEDQIMEVEEESQEETEAQPPLHDSPMKENVDHRPDIQDIPMEEGNYDGAHNDEPLNSTMDMFLPPPTREASADDTMALFRMPATPTPTANKTVALDDTVDESLQIINHQATEDTDAVALKVAQMWNASRNSRESPITPERSYDFGDLCFDCGLVLESPEALEQHLKHHDREFACVLCDESRTFNTAQTLMQHLCNEHSKETRDDSDDIMCEYCERFFTPKVFVPHLIFDCYSAPCGICGVHIQKLRHSERVGHRRRHKDHKRFRCSCDQTFANYLLFKQHVCSAEKEITFDMKEELFAGVLADDIADASLIEHMKRIKVAEADITPPAEENTSEAPDTILIVDTSAVDQPPSSPNIFAGILAAAEAAMETPEKAPPSVMIVEPPSVMVLEPPPPPPTLADLCPQSVMILDPPPLAPELPPPSVMILDPPSDAVVTMQPPAAALNASAFDLLNENIQEEADDTQDSQSSMEGSTSQRASTATTMDQTVALDDTDDDEIEFLEAVTTPSKKAPVERHDDDIVAVEATPANTSLSWNNEDGDMLVAELPAGQRTDKTGRDKKFKCRMCSHAFYTNKSLEAHQKERHSTDISQYDKLYDEEYGMPVNGYAYVCLHCNAAFERPDRFQTHFGAHISIQSLLLQCEYCSGIQLSTDNLNTHKEQHGYRKNGTTVEPKIRWRCTECPTNVVFTDESGYMLHVAQEHQLPIFYYCKSCFMGSCGFSAIVQHVNGNCTARMGTHPILGMGFVPANQINYQPASEADYKAELQRNPGMAVNLSNCTHRTFVRFGIKWASCFEERGCFGLINANRFEQHLRVMNNHFDEGEMPPHLFPPTVYARPDYNFKNWLHNNQITLITQEHPWPWPYQQQVPVSRRVAQINGTRRTRGTALVAGPPAMIHPTSSGQMAPGRVPPQPQQAVPMQQMPPPGARYQMQQRPYLPAYMPGAPMPVQQMYQLHQMPVPVPMNLMSCAICEQAGVMQKQFMIPMPRDPAKRQEYIQKIMERVGALIGVDLQREITNRMSQPEAHICWNHVNPHCITTQGQQIQQIFVPPANVCFDYPKYTERILANPVAYKQKLESIIISARSSNFNVYKSVEMLKAENVCGDASCSYRVISSNAEVQLHFAHRDQNMKMYCATCPTFFDKDDDLTMLKHILSDHYPRVKISMWHLGCPLCRVVCNAPSDFTLHMMTAHPSLLPVPAMRCATRHATNAARDQHDMMHNQLYGQSCCFICGKVDPPTLNARAGSFLHLEHHLVHAMDCMFTCRHCLSSFHQECDFLAHCTMNHQVMMDANGVVNCCRIPCGGPLSHHLIEAHLIKKYWLKMPEEAQRRNALVVVLNDELYRRHIGLPQRIYRG